MQGPLKLRIILYIGQPMDIIWKISQRCSQITCYKFPVTMGISPILPIGIIILVGQDKGLCIPSLISKRGNISFNINITKRHPRKCNHLSVFGGSSRAPYNPGIFGINIVLEVTVLHLVPLAVGKAFYSNQASFHKVGKYIIGVNYGTATQRGK